MLACQSFSSSPTSTSDQSLPYPWVELETTELRVYLGVLLMVGKYRTTIIKFDTGIRHRPI